MEALGRMFSTKPLSFMAYVAYVAYLTMPSLRAIMVAKRNNGW